MTVPQPVWNNMRGRLYVAFRELTQELQQIVPQATVFIGQSDNPVFPFGAYATFRIAHDAVGIDVSVDCKRSGDQFIITADVARETGYVLSDGPTAVVTATAPDADTALAHAIASIATYVRAQADRIATELVQSSADAPS